MSNTFEFAERLGFESPFEFDDLTNDFNFIWTGVVDYNKLVDKFNAGSFIYNPDSLLRGMITKLSLRKNLENYLLGNSNKYPD